MRKRNPVHAIDWILSYGTRLRMISAGQLRQRLDRPKGHCTWCGRQVPAGRRTWCSSDCVAEFNIRCNPASARWAVEQRDEGICAICGTDTMKIVRIIRHVQRDDWFLGHGLMRRLGFGDRLHVWEMDHIVPVSEGGGLCSLDNLRTLCIPCHLGESAALAGRRASNLIDSQSGPR